MKGALISDKDWCEGNDEGPRERSHERRSGGSGSGCGRCSFHGDEQLHLMIGAVVASAANVPLPSFGFQRDAVLSGGEYLVLCCETALLELCSVHFHHVVVRFRIVEPCHKTLFILVEELQIFIVSNHSTCASFLN